MRDLQENQLWEAENNLRNVSSLWSVNFKLHVVIGIFLFFVNIVNRTGQFKN